MDSSVDIFYWSLFRSDFEFGSIPLYMARAFGKTNRVFYINHPITVKDYLGEKNKRKTISRHLQIEYSTFPGASDNMVLVEPPLSLSINWLPKGKAYQTLFKARQNTARKIIGDIVQKYDVDKFIYINCYDPFFWIDNSGAEVHIYQCIDDIQEDAYTAKHGHELEKLAITQADLTLVTSSELFRLKSPYAQKIQLLPNAADVKRFRRVVEETFKKPEEIEHIQTRIIGFVGNLDQMRIDYSLLKKIAEEHSDKTLLLVGPINNTTYKTLGIDQLPNVILTGQQDQEDLLAYMAYMDCTIIPFRKNKLTKSIYPLKINEYLATGKPVISTTFSEDIRGFKEVAYLAENEHEFIESIEQALQENSSEKIEARLKVAEQNTWKTRLETFWNTVEPLLNLG